MSSSLADWIALILALIFLIGGVANLAGPRPLREAYVKWGYPAGFHVVTGALELAAGALLLFSPTRPYGIVLAGLVTAAALATLVRSHEFAHTLPSVLIIGSIAAWAALAR